MLNRRSKLLLSILAVTVIMACVPSLTPAQPAAPAMDPAQINLIVAQTAGAASTLTALAMPTGTATDTPPPSQTFTPTAVPTETIEPTATATLIYIYYTPTSFTVPTLGPTQPYKSTSNKNYDCKILIAPKQKEFYNPRVQFKVKWRVQNIGRKDWERPDVKYAYDSGDKFHIVDRYGIPWDTPIGDLADLFVEMQAPKNPGTYTATWMMEAGGEKFCKMTLTINVIQ